MQPGSRCSDCTLRGGNHCTDTAAHRPDTKNNTDAETLARKNHMEQATHHGSTRGRLLSHPLPHPRHWPCHGGVLVGAKAHMLGCASGRFLGRLLGAHDGLRVWCGGRWSRVRRAKGTWGESKSAKQTTSNVTVHRSEIKMNTHRNRDPRLENLSVVWCAWVGLAKMSAAAVAKRLQFGARTKGGTYAGNTR